MGSAGKEAGEIQICLEARRSRRRLKHDGTRARRRRTLSALPRAQPRTGRVVGRHNGGGVGSEQRGTAVALENQTRVRLMAAGADPREVARLSPHTQRRRAG
ncbi:leucine-rich repeat extensin-like protein 3 [Iris pallida]|uniref:Leucine-rich repeat extensin-like protein 3 n=1 Tax=Iris pallida TaxID=29817 RepID=A0AAX6I1A5_IRIPA|nr:leucine-rich repeat extensin-like protein 3 [Iris pallida]